MMRTTRSFGGKRRTVAVTVAASLLLTACGGSEDEPETAPDTEEPADDGASEEEPADDGSAAAEDLGTVTVALSVPESVVFLPADLGPSQGAFEECGIEVENIVGESSTVGRSLAAGEADIALQNGSRGVGDILQGIEAKLVAGQENKWSQVLVVSNEMYEAGIQSPDDVRAIEDGNYSFGISSFGSAGHLSALKLAESLGWTEGQEYQIVPMGGVNEITAGLEAGAIDAFAWSREVAYNMETQGVGNVIEDLIPEAVGPTLFEVFLASDTFIEERPDALKAYFECYFAYVEELQADPEQVRELAIENWDSNPETLDQTLELIVSEWNTDGSASDEELEGLAEATVFQNDEVDEAPVEDWWLYWQDV